MKHHLSTLRSFAGINGYTVEAARKKAAFHRAARLFLQRLADDIGLPQSTYEVRSNAGGMAVSGEVTLHGETFYAWLQESCVGKPGLTLYYRACRGRGDYCGGINRQQRLDTLTLTRYPALVAECRALSTRVGVVL